MKFILIGVFFLSMLGLASGQGTFVYDQQSADELGVLEGGAVIQSNQPLGQSFVPSLSSVDFIRISVFDANPTDSLGGTIFLNLRASSLNGTIIGSTAPVAMTNGSAGFLNLFFATSVSVSPGSTYFFEPLVVESGATPLTINKAHYNYPGGQAFIDGQVDQFNDDLWFREGLIVPEPSSGMLLLLGLAAWVYRCRTGAFFSRPHQTVRRGRKRGQTSQI